MMGIAHYAITQMSSQFGLQLMFAFFYHFFISLQWVQSIKHLDFDWDSWSWTQWDVIFEIISPVGRDTPSSVLLSSDAHYTPSSLYLFRHQLFYYIIRPPLYLSKNNQQRGGLEKRMLTRVYFSSIKAPRREKGCNFSEFTLLFDLFTRGLCLFHFFGKVKRLSDTSCVSA